MRTKIAIPMGDPAGVGPEIVVKTAVSKEILDLCDLVVIGDKNVLEKAIEICQVNLKIHTIKNVEEGKYEKGIHADLSKIKPPFIYYKFPNDIPSIDSLRRKYYRENSNDYFSLWESLMYGEGGAALADFGNYTVGSYLSGFTNIPLSKELPNPNTSRKDFHRFEKSLSKKQKKLLEKYHSKRFSNRFSFTIKNTIVKKKASDNEVIQALNDFENSLSPSKKREYKNTSFILLAKKISLKISKIMILI